MRPEGPRERRRSDAREIGTSAFYLDTHLKKLTRIIKTVTNAITGCGIIQHWPED